MQRHRPVIGALVIAAAIAACGGSPPAPGSTGGLNVVTTTTVFADIVHNVGGDRVTVRSIVPAGVGPEDYEPKPDDARLLAGARLIVKNGVGLDDFLDRLLDANSTSAPVLTLGDGIPTVSIDGEANPHFWLDPTLVRDRYLPAIEAQLSALDPAGAATYRANAETYARQLDALDTTLMAKVASIPAAERKLVTFHDAFPYFARHFGFELIGVILENVGQEPTASDLAVKPGPNTFSRRGLLIPRRGLQACFAQACGDGFRSQSLSPPLAYASDPLSPSNVRGWPLHMTPSLRRR